MNARSWTLHNGATLHLSPAAYGSWFARLTEGQRSIGCVASTRREALRTVKQFYRTPEIAQVSTTQQHIIRLATGHLVTLTRRADGWSAQCKAVSAFGASPREALRFLRPLLVPAPSGDVTRERLLAGPYRVTVQGQSGYGLTVRDAYQAAWRALRLSRHDPADLLRQIADLRRAIGQKSPRVGVLDEVIIDTLAHAGDDYDGVVEAVRVRRRARHTAAIRAHRARLAQTRAAYEDVLKEVREAHARRLNGAVADLEHEIDALHRELDDLRHHLDVAQGEASRDFKTLKAISETIEGARAKDPHVAHLVPFPYGHNLLPAIRALVEHTARAAEYHRRATAAEARASELHAGQQSLLAAARAAGFEYAVSAGAARFTPVNAEAPEGDAGPRAAQPTGGETPTDRPQDAPDARQPA